VSDENKPVICPWCGRAMFRTPCKQGLRWIEETKEWVHEGEINFTCICGAQTPIKENTPTAIKAAMDTHRPPNRPLTREQVAEMPALSGVWVYEDNENILLETAETAIIDYEEGISTGCIYFSAPPTPADIEAARKEEAHDKA